MFLDGCIVYIHQNTLIRVLVAGNFMWVFFFFHFQSSCGSSIALNIHVRESLSARVTFMELLLCLMRLIASLPK